LRGILTELAADAHGVASRGYRRLQKRDESRQLHYYLKKLWMDK